MGTTTTTLNWLNGKRFVGIDSTNHSVVLSSKDEGVGVRPSDMLLIALSACTAVDVVEILAKKRMALSSLEIITSGEQDADPPWTFRRIHLKYRLSGEGLTEKAIEQAIQLSEEKYCSVAATVRGIAQITQEFEIISKGDQK
jgi:putative redox protein